MRPRQPVVPQSGGFDTEGTDVPPLKLTEEEREELLRELTEEIEMMDEKLAEIIEEANLEIEEEPLEEDVGLTQLSR